MNNYSEDDFHHDGGHHHPHHAANARLPQHINSENLGGVINSILGMFLGGRGRNGRGVGAGGLQ